MKKLLSTLTLVGLLSMSVGVAQARYVDTLNNKTSGVMKVNQTNSTLQVFSKNGSNAANVGGVLSVNTTTAGNVDTDATDLFTYAMPAGLLGADKDTLVAEVFGTFAANANNKQVVVTLDDTTLFDSTAVAANAGNFSIRVTLMRTGSATQLAKVEVFSSNSTFGASTVAFIAGTENLATALNLKVTATGVASNDIVKRGSMVSLVRGQ